MGWNIFVLQKLHGWTDGYNGHNACPPTHWNRGSRIHISLPLDVISLWKVVHFWTMSLNSLPCCSLRNKIIHMSSRQHGRPSDYVMLEEKRPVGFERGAFIFVIVDMEIRFYTIDSDKDQNLSLWGLGEHWKNWVLLWPLLSFCLRFAWVCMCECSIFWGSS